MKNIYKKKTRLISTTINIIGAVILIYIQSKICQIQWYVTNDIAIYIKCAIEILKLFLVFHIIYKLQNPVYKLLWVIITVFFPVPAAILYVFFGNTEIPISFEEKANMEYTNTRKYLKFDDKIYDEVKELDKIKYNQVKYLSNTTGLPLYRNSHVEYFNLGEKYFEMLLKDISNAKKYIFLEYFSIAEGNLWNEMFNMLKQKASEGVKVFIITDDMANSEKYPKNFKKNLEEAGIEYIIFNPLNIMVNVYINYRNHRKIAVVDGKIAYTGGPNVGDEYINVYPKYGHWKDTGIKITGEAVVSYISIFIEIWNVCTEYKKLDYKNFIDTKLIDNNISKGYIMPYCDGPDNSSNPAQNLYIQLINTTREYIYITTPYLILDNELLTALVNCAKSGVDIRIITPYIPDKPLVQIVSRSFYQILLEAGVKIYEYKPGFIHSKTFVIDDETATIGSINLDFRGLNFHYECGSWIYKTGTEIIIKEDFLKTQEKCLEINLENWKKRGLFKRISDKILITFSPLI